MRLVFGLVLILGVGLAGLAVYMARGYFSSYQAELEHQKSLNSGIVETVDVFVSTHEVRYGKQLKFSDVKLVKWPKNAIPSGAFTKASQLFPNGDEKLRSVLRTMEAGEAILRTKVTDPGEEAGITSRLSRGMRAFTIKVDVTSGVSGFLRPGDRVDVYWSGKGTGSNREGITKLIESGIRLVAVDQSADDDRKGASVAKTVTAEVSPTQVASLAQAQNTGRLSLSLVGVDDNTIADGIEVDQNRLLGIQTQEIAAVQRQKVCTVKTRRGAEVVMIPVACTN